MNKKRKRDYKYMLAIIIYCIAAIVATILLYNAALGETDEINSIWVIICICSVYAGILAILIISAIGNIYTHE